jgi:hypothetical protein
LSVLKIKIKVRVPFTIKVRVSLNITNIQIPTYIGNYQEYEEIKEVEEEEFILILFKDLLIKT